ncbi:MAG: hypothetical protein WD749_05170 [Phycisphaerales bacterium]
MIIEPHVRAAGGLMLVLAGLHLFFPRWLGWRADLAKLSLLNRQIFVVHTAFIVLVLVLMGLLSVAGTRMLLDRSPLAGAVLAGFTLFWGVRLLVQIGYYDERLWQGHAGRSVAHVVATLVWTYFTGVFAVALLTR